MLKVIFEEAFEREGLVLQKEESLEVRLAGLSYVQIAQIKEYVCKRLRELTGVGFEHNPAINFEKTRFMEDVLKMDIAKLNTQIKRMSQKEKKKCD